VTGRKEVEERFVRDLCARLKTKQESWEADGQMLYQSKGMDEQRLVVSSKGCEFKWG
jgi:hypothetical protein